MKKGISRGFSGSDGFQPGWENLIKSYPLYYTY